MGKASTDTSQLQQWLGRLAAGDSTARDELIRRSCERLTRLTRKMFRSERRLRRWELTDDVFQNSVLRLHRALADVRPESVEAFFRLAAVQIRRELIDLARHHLGPEGEGRHRLTAGPDGNVPDLDPAASDTDEPSHLAMWSEFHGQVEALPDDERAVFELLWYQGLEQAEAATLLDISERTVQRRWKAARLRLQETMAHLLPDT